MTEAKHPKEINNAQSSSWIAQIQGLENLTFKLRDFQLPSVSLGRMEVSNRDTFTVKEPGTTLTFDDLSLTFLVDESRANYNSVLAWMFNCSKHYEERGVTAYMLDNAGKIVCGYEFMFAFPTMIGPIVFDVENETTELLCTANLTYSMFVPLNANGEPKPEFSPFVQVS